MTPHESPSARTRLDLRRGIVLMCGAVVLFTVSSTMVKGLGQGYPVSQMVFFRCLVAFLPLYIAIRRAGGWRVFGQPKASRWRACGLAVRRMSIVCGRGCTDTN